MLQAYYTPGERQNIGDYMYKPDLSDEEYGVWVQGQNAVVAIRGYDGPDDMPAELAIALGTASPPLPCLSSFIY